MSQLANNGVGSNTATASMTPSLQRHLDDLIELSTTLKHVHWNLTGPQFIAIHVLVDTQVDATRDMVDALAERMATLDYPPDGRLSTVAGRLTRPDYPLTRATVDEHLGALVPVYEAVIDRHRDGAAGWSSDPVTQDLLVGQIATLERQQWFLRTHLPSSGAEDGGTKP